MIFPPGTILQRMYLRERLRRLKPGKFIEVGVGQGWLSKLLCDDGWCGVGFDLNADTLAVASHTMRDHIKSGRFQLVHDNWLNSATNDKVDLIISSMVIEHLDEQDEARYFEKCKLQLTDDGAAILFVPSSMTYWGIEDEIAGHYRRYDRASLQKLMQKVDWNVIKITGLTYPVSNLLFPLSEWLIKRSENKKMALDVLERTKASGNRHVKFKTTFPLFLKCFLNEFVMYPLHLLQKHNAHHPACMVMYLECQPANE